MRFKKNPDEMSELTTQEPVNSETNVEEITSEKEADLQTMYLNLISDMCNIIDSQINLMQKLKDSMSKLSDE